MIIFFLKDHLPVMIESAIIKFFSVDFTAISPEEPTVQVDDRLQVLEEGALGVGTEVGNRSAGKRVIKMRTG